MLRVDLGCGTNKPDGFIGVDRYPGLGVDIVTDLNQQFPFPDHSVDELRAYDVIEHLLDKINTMNEIWRICKPGGKVDIFVPSTDGRGAFQDPTHVTFWNINSFLYYCIDFPNYLDLCSRYGFKGAFKVVRLENEEMSGGVIHVRAELTAVKPQTDLKSLADPTFQNQTASETYIKAENSQLGSKTLSNNDVRNLSESQFINYPVIKTVSEGIFRPLCSVMIPTYNGTKYLEQTLKSVLEQDPGSNLMQIEVIDDCSTQDDPEELVREIGQGRVSFYRQPKNAGLIANWNTCIRHAHGYWVHILHQDDVVKFGFYSGLQAAVEKEPTIGAAFCRHFYINEESCQQELSLLEKETPGVLSNWIERIAVVQRIQFPSIVVRREVYEELGGFCPEAYSAADWEMWKRIAAHYSVWYEPEPLACYRLHSLSESSRLIRSGANIADTRRAIEISRSYLPKPMAAELLSKALEHYALYAMNTAREMLAIGDRATALAQMQEGLKCSQSSRVKETLVSILLSGDLDESNQYLAQLSGYIEQYQKEQNHESTFVKLRHARNEIANKWLSLQVDHLENVYSHDVGRAHQMLLNSNIKHEPLTDEEKKFVNELVTRIFK